MIRKCLTVRECNGIWYFGTRYSKNDGMHKNSQQYQNMYSVMKNRSICMDLNIGMRHRRENYYEYTRYD